MKTKALVLALVGALGLVGCAGRSPYRKQARFRMPSDERIALDRLRRYYAKHDIEGVLRTLDHRRMANYKAVERRLMEDFRTAYETDLTFEVHKVKDLGTALDFRVHWKKTRFDIWKQKHVPSRGLTHFVVSRERPAKVIDVHGDPFF